MFGHPPFQETYVKAELSVQVVFALLSEVHKQISRSHRQPSHVLVKQHDKLVNLLAYSISDTDMSYSGLMAALPTPDLRRDILVRAFRVALQKKQTQLNSNSIQDRLVAVGRLYYDLYKGEEVGLFRKEEQHGAPVAKKKRWLVLCNKRAGWLASSQEEIESGVKWNLKTKYEVQSNQFLLKLQVLSAHQHISHRKNQSFSAVQEETLLSEESSDPNNENPSRGNSADSRGCKSSRTLPRTSGNLTNHKSMKSLFQRKTTSYEVEEQIPLRVGVALLVSLQVSVQGAPFLTKHFPFIFTGAPVEFSLLKFNTSHDLEKVSIRHCFHLNYIASGLLNYMSHLCVDDMLEPSRLSLQELGVVLESSVFKEAEHQHSEGDTKLRAVLKWLSYDSNWNNVKRESQRELIGIVKSIEWGEVEQETIREAKPKFRSIFKNSEDILEEMEKELELRGKPMRASQQNPELQTTIPEKSQFSESQQKSENCKEEQYEESKTEIRFEKDQAYNQSSVYMKELQAKDEQIASLKNQILKLKQKKSKKSTRGYELNQVSISSVDQSTNLVPIKSRLSVTSSNMEDSDIISSFFISYAVDEDEDEEIKKVRKSLESPKQVDATNNSESMFSGLNTMCHTEDVSSPKQLSSTQTLQGRERSSSLLKVILPLTSKANQRRFVIESRKSERTLPTSYKYSRTTPVGIQNMSHIHTPRKTAEPILISQIKLQNDRTRSPVSILRRIV